MVRLVIRAAAHNEASQRVALGAGFRPSGRDRCAERLRDGTLADLLRFELIEADLQASDDRARVAREDGAHASSSGRHAMSGRTPQGRTPHDGTTQLPGSPSW
jgi:hypothetical protein